MVGHRAAWSRAAELLDQMHQIEAELRESDALAADTAERIEKRIRFTQLETELRSFIAEMSMEGGGTGSGSDGC